MEKVIRELTQGFETSNIDKRTQSDIRYRTEFVINNYKMGKKVLSSIEDELLDCEEFYISVAFITMGGVTPLLQTLKILEERNIKGKIITTDYLCFSDPKAISKLASLKNIEIKIYSAKNIGFHTKGYIFKKKNIYRIIMGSANMTMAALTKNNEWNTKIVSTHNGEYVNEVMNEFHALWSNESTIAYDDFIEDYIKTYNQNHNPKINEFVELSNYIPMTLRPNKMQQEFITNLQQMINEGKKRALLLSATGTGKTYAAAFALKQLQLKKVLFLVHREQIAKQAILSFKKVFGNTHSFGLLSGSSKDLECDYLFSTMQMMAKEEVRTQFEKQNFEAVVIDEVHRVGSKSYQKIMDYFTPKLYLGMTASPERTDGFDIYKLFDHNIAYEIRLQQAMEEDMLCPFHYFGITDLEIDGYSIDDTSQLHHFSHLISNERVNHIIDKAKYFGYSGSRVKGLVFCSSIKEAIALSDAFNERQYRTIVLSGQHDQETRENAIERLTSNNRHDMLDYIFTVDIFNEGVDIPDVNQVIMLRPTKSPVVFIQQLGRGLRNAKNKEFVVILDFIGNYNNNFMIPIALSGDRSYNKDNMRRYLMEGERVIPGSSTIHFDEISKKKIFKSIDSSNFNDIRIIKDSYFEIKQRLNRIPSIHEFEKYGEVEMERIFAHKALGSYHMFLKKYDKTYTTKFTKEMEEVLEYISKKFANGKRIQELLLLKILLNQEKNIFNELSNILYAEYSIQLDVHMKKNIINIMTNKFLTGINKNTYSNSIFIEEGKNGYTISKQFDKMLTDIKFKDMVIQLVKYGIDRFNHKYRSSQESNFKLYQKYTYEDVCRLLNWYTNEVPLNIGGYKYDKNTKTLPVFINYDKSDNIHDTIKYHDRFLSEKRLIAISKQGRTIVSDDVQRFVHACRNGIQVELFVRKNKDDKMSKEFYYLGKIFSTGTLHEVIMPNTTKTAVEVEWLLEHPIRDDLYKYIVEG